MFRSIVFNSVSAESKVGYFECPAEIEQTAATFQHPMNLQWTFMYVVHSLHCSRPHRLCYKRFGCLKETKQHSVLFQNCAQLYSTSWLASRGLRCCDEPANLPIY